MEILIDKIKLLSKLSFNTIENNNDPMQVYLYIRQMIIEAEAVEKPITKENID